MFAKPYKLKSVNTLKNTEKKQLVQRVQEAFPSASEEAVKSLLPGKGTTSCLKLTLHSTETVQVYAVDGVPVLVCDAGGALLPTVCALWKVPDLVPTITIHAPVLSKILGGAPLYLPGVEMPPHGVGFPMFAKGAIIAACTTDNSAAGLVGRAAMGSADMLLKAAGVCVETLQVFGDQLSKELKFQKLERPRFPPALNGVASAADLITSISELTITPTREEWPALGGGGRGGGGWGSAGDASGRSQSAPAAPSAPHLPPSAPRLPASAPNAPALITDDSNQPMDDTLDTSANSDTLEPDETAPPADMDGLLRWCLLCFLRVEGKNIELPLKTSLLYRNHLIPMCPPDRTLDVKKSTYKKMGKFLDAMKREGLLEVKEVEKGVDAVTAMNLAHPLVRAHRVPPGLRGRLAEAREAKENDDQVDYVPPQVREMLCATAAVADLLAVKKGTPLTSSEVRSALTEYVRARELSAPSRGALTLDAPLALLLGKQPQETIKWDALMTGVAAKMTSATELRWADGQSRLIKSRLEPVSMQVVNRSGNKKVTLVNNLESYGFVLPPLATACQRGVGAACGVTRSPGAKADQLMLQGDQTHFVAKLLVEKYGLPKKFVDGADKALNKKK